MQALALIAFNSLLLAAAATDLHAMRIPNRLCLAMAVGALLFALPWGDAALVQYVGAFAVTGAVGFGLFLAGVLGGGDMKLLAATALWIPLPSLGAFAALLAVAGGAQALATLAWARLVGRDGAATQREIPYAVAIAIAGLAWSALQAGSAA